MWHKPINATRCKQKIRYADTMTPHRSQHTQYATFSMAFAQNNYVTMQNPHAPFTTCKQGVAKVCQLVKQRPLRGVDEKNE